MNQRTGSVDEMKALQSAVDAILGYPNLETLTATASDVEIHPTDPTLARYLVNDSNREAVEMAIAKLGLKTVGPEVDGKDWYPTRTRPDPAPVDLRVKTQAQNDVDAAAEEKQAAFAARIEDEKLDADGAIAEPAEK